MPEHFPVVKEELQKAVNCLITGWIGLGQANGVKSILENWKQGNSDEWGSQALVNQKKKFAEIMLD